MSGIEWTGVTWNPIVGCSIESEGCHNCYAMRMAARLAAMGQEPYQDTTRKVKNKAFWTGDINEAVTGCSPNRMICREARSSS